MSLAPQQIETGPCTQKRLEGRPGLIHRARSRFWLAPMAGITDVVFRRLLDEMEAGVLVSELVSAKGLLYKSGKTAQMMRVHKNPGAMVGIQLFGESAEDIIEASRFVQKEEAAFIDINLGCPVKKVVKKGCGAALMRDPDYLEKFLSQIKRNIDLPLTVKMRTGWSEEELTIHECVEAADRAGCEWVAIHGRTRSQGYGGRADWDLIAEVAERANIPIIGNGDIRTAPQAILRLEQSKTAAVMIGRGALRNPWIFKECLGKPGREENSPLVLIHRYLEGLREFYDLRHTLIFLRKFCAWLAFGYPGAAAFRRNLFERSRVVDLMECAEEFFQYAGQLPVPRFENSEAFMMGGHG